MAEYYRDNNIKDYTNGDSRKSVPRVGNKKFVLMCFYSDDPVAQYLEGRTKIQKEVIRFFYNAPEPDGCFSKKPLMTREEFLRFRNARADQITKAQALSKLNIDESEVSEIEPVRLEGHLWNELHSNDWFIFFNDYSLSTLYQITWLFFSSDQFYVYQCSFNLISNFEKERTEEYFYKDVTSFSTGTDTSGHLEFSIVVPGDKFNCAINNGDPETERTIQGMKSILRDKKRNL